LVSSVNGRVSAFFADNRRAEFVWNASVNSAIIAKPLVINDNSPRIIIASDKNGIYALNIQDGQQSWVNSNSFAYASPLLGVANDNGGTDVVLSGIKGNIMRLDSVSGNVVWETSVDGNTFAAARVAGSAIVVFDSLGMVNRIDSKTGRRLGQELVSSGSAVVQTSNVLSHLSQTVILSLSGDGVLRSLSLSQ
jgi:outer membrane protein assembly factor BamB